MSGRPRTRVELDSMTRLDLAGVLGRAVRELLPPASAGQVGHLDVSPLGWNPPRVCVEWRACPFGGVRPMWRCPRCAAGRRVLYVASRGLFCRGCVTSNGRPLVYRSQRVDPSMRAQLRGDALARLLGGEDGRWAPPKPPRMWWRTYWRIVARIAAFEQLRVDRLGIARRIDRLESRVARRRSRT